MKATIKEIARISGYSYATVSRVLSDQPNVKPETKSRILEIMADLDYRPQLCKKIKNRINRSEVMIIVDDMTNHFYAGLITSMTETLKQQGYLGMVGVSGGDEDTEIEYLKRAQQMDFAGIIMITVSDSHRMRDLLVETEAPVVLVNRYIQSIDLDVVCIDNLRGGYMAGEYLAGLGHRKLCHLAGPFKSSASRDRTRGFEEALRDAGIDFDLNRDVFYGDLRYEGGFQFGKEFIAKRYDYTAIFCGNDLMARGFTEAIGEAGKTVPGDISVIGFDDSPSAVSGPMKFTTIWREPEVMGTMAATMLIERMTMQRTEPFKMVYPPQLLIRDSCSSPRGQLR